MVIPTYQMIFPTKASVFPTKLNFPLKEGIHVNAVFYLRTNKM